MVFKKIVSRLTFSKTAPAGDVGEAFGTILLYPFIIIDVPLSFVGDTLMLPVKGIQNYHKINFK